jgi:CheY-like chemotaxis protein
MVLVDKRTYELQSAKELAEAATRAKGDFVANMSHEIRTPLNGVMGMLDLIAQSELTGDQKQLLTMAQDSANSLLVVINDVLDFSKIEAGKLVFDIQEFDLAEIVADAVRTMALRAHQKGLELAYQVDPTIPQFLKGDAGRIKQVLTNLIGNAIKFTERGEVVLRASAEQMLGEAIYLHFAVSDTGIGVPPEKQQLIFEAFSQADASTTRKFGGTGLGLAICSRIVELMGGKIWIESNAGRGSTFAFTAKLKIAVKLHPGQAKTSGIDLEGVPALIVDDNQTNRFILEQMLFAWGLKTTAVDSADGALRAMKEALRQGRPYKLVLTDNHMPGVDGFELVQRMKQSPDLATAAVMMLTSDDYHDSARRCRNMGIASHLIKPVKQSELLAVIRKVLTPSSDVEQGPLPVQTAPIGKFLILLAEDNLVNQRLAVRLLERMGHEVVVAQTGREALEKFRNNAFDLVLMDVQMPEMDGFAATEAIRKSEQGKQKHVPVIAMTAHAMKGDRESCLAAGMDGYISKPAGREELQQAIEIVMKASMAAS